MAARQPPAQPTPAVGAAAAAPGAHPQYALPKYTPEEYYVQQKQATEIQRDTRSLNALDTTAPFVNLQDAVVRLLPFHVSPPPVSMVQLVLIKRHAPPHASLWCPYTVAYPHSTSQQPSGSSSS